MTRSRRSVLAALAGGAALLAGCGSSDRAGTPSGTPDEGTPTATFATAADETATQSPTERRTETPDEIGRALASARTEIATAIERLDAAAVVVDGQVGIVSSDAFAEYARVESRRQPISRARAELDAVSDRATGDRSRSVNGLLFCCTLLETRAAQQDAIVDGFSSFYQATRAFPTDLELEAARGAVRRMRMLPEQVGTARDSLDRVAPRADALGVDGFDVASARSRQATLRAIAREFEPAFAGALSTMRALGLLSATAPAIEKGNFERAAGFAGDAVVATGNGTGRLETALERDVRHYRPTFERYRCLAAGLETAGERYSDAAEAYLNDAPETGRERYRAAKEALAATENECGIEL